MTVLFGASCDDGVIVATDSLRVASKFGWGWPLHMPTTKLHVEQTGRKIRRIGDRFAFVPSGNGFRWETTGAGICDLGSLDEIAHGLFGDLEKSVLGLAGDPLWIAGGKPEYDDVQLLVGGGPVGTPPELLFMRRRYALAAATPAGAVEIMRIPRRGFVARGVMEPWADTVGLERAVLPAHVGDALPVIVALCHACVAHWRGRFEGFAPISFPLQLAVITPERAFVKQIPELAPAIGDRVMEQLRTQGLSV